MLGFGGIGGMEALVILCFILIFFGAKKLPELAKGLGQGIKEFKKATREVTDEVNSAMVDDPQPARRINPTPVQNAEPQSTVVAQATPAAPSVKRID